MPNYEYRCPECGHVETRNRPIERRDDWVTCKPCHLVMRETLMERLPSAPGVLTLGILDR